MSSSIQLTLIPFNTKVDVFRLWKMQVVTYLKSLNLYNELIEKDETEDEIKLKTDSTTDLPSLDNWKVKSFLLLSIGRETLSLLHNVADDSTTAQSIWKQLIRRFENKSNASKFYLRSQLMTMQIKTNERIQDYIARIIKLSEELESIDHKLPDDDLLFTLLKGIQNTEYKNIASTLLLLDNITFDKAVKHILDIEVQQKSSETSHKSDLVNYVNKLNNNLKRTNLVKVNQCKFCKRTNHNYENCDRRLKRCLNCHKEGHFARDCKNRNGNNNNNYENNYTNNNLSDKKSFIGFVANVFEQQQKHKWILDSGCTSHYCNDISMLSEIKTDISNAICANGESLKIDKIGTVYMENENNNITLTNVKFNQNFAQNLISIPKLIEHGATVMLKGNEAIIEYNQQIVMKGMKRNGLYYLTSKLINKTEKVLLVNSNENLIHNRIGHIGNSALKLLRDKEAIKGIETIDINNIEKCETCLISKAHRNAFGNKSGREKAREPLERIHCDLSSLKCPNERYVSVIIDEYSRRGSIKILNYKSETADHIINWIKQNEVKLNSKVKELHSDGGGEYTAASLQSFLAEKGIKFTMTCRGTPQHNGIAERFNRTLFNTARCLLQHSKLNLEFTEYAIKTAAYLLQFRSAMTDKNKTSYEQFYQIKPHIKHLKVFGCDCYVHTNDNSKLEARAVKGIFVGYSELKENGYEVLLIDNDKVITSRDVVFEENQFTFGRRLQESRLNELNELQHNSVSSISVPITNYNESEEINLNNYYQVVSTDQLPVIINSNNESNEGKGIMINDESNSNNTNELSNELIEVNNESTELRRSRRDRRQPERYGQMNINDVYDEDRLEMGFNVSESIIKDPLTVEEALSSDRAEKWKDAMNVEFQQLMENKTWEVCELPLGRKAIDNKWVFKTKLNSDGTIEREKARLCAKGFSQIPYIDFNETFAPVLKYKSLRILLALATIKKYEIEHLDVQTAFLNAELNEEIYMKLPKNYEVKTKAGKQLVCKLKKSIYGLKQASHEWNMEINKTIKLLNFTQCKSDTCVYWKQSNNNNKIILAIFVDDIIVIHSSNDNNEWNELKKNLMNTYKMKDNSNKDTQLILGMRIIRDSNSLKISQELQINKALKEFNMENCKEKFTPSEILKLTEADCPQTDEETLKMKNIPYMSLVGNVLYVSLCTRPDISYSVNCVSRFCKNPGQNHWIAGKRILRYLKATSSLGLKYENNRSDDSIELIGYCDADWAGNVDDRRSTTGFVIKINNCVVHWGSKKQDTVSLSSAEAEYMSICSTVTELKWFTSLLNELQVLTNPTPILYCDNQSAIAISQNDKFHNRTKHIDIRHHFIRDAIKNKEVELKWIESKEQDADILTKSLAKPIFEKLRSRIMMDKK